MTSIRTRLGGGLPTSFWRLWLASAASNLSDGMFWIALPLLAITLTDSPVLIAGVVVASRLPWLLFALVAGALADRLDRRKTMVIVDVFRGGLLGALAVATFAGVASLPVLYVVAFVLGVAETLFDTSAQSIMPNIVGPEKLSLANSRLYAVELMMNQFVGPPLGGFLAAAGTAIAFGAGAAAYLIAAMAIFTIAGSFRPVREGPPTRIHEEIAEGLRYLIHHPLLRVLAVMVGVGNLANSAVFSVLVLYVVAPGPLGLDEVGFGLLMTSMAIGSLGGTFIVEPLERRLGRANLLAISIVGFSIPLIVPGLTTSLPLVAGSMVLGGLIGIAWNVVTVSLRQRIVPDRLLGRVNASYRLLAWGTIPVGAALGGFIGEAFGLRAVFLIFGGLELLLVFGRLLVTEEAIRTAEAGAGPRPTADPADPADPVA
jgi:MFS family permease